MKTFNIGREFSGDPAGRYRSDGGFNGERFREDVLRPLISQLKDNEKLILVIDDDVESYGSSFLTEVFGGMVKYGYITKLSLLDKVEFSFTDPDYEFYKNKAIQYINEAKFKSVQYIATKGP